MLSYSSVNVSRLAKLTFAFLWLAWLVLFFNFPARAATGDFDSSFGTNGSLGLDDPHYFYDVALQADGKILALGYTRTGAPGYSRYPTSIMRFQANGTIDASFGANGRLRPQAGTNIVERSSFALQPDGKIVLAGVSRPDLSGTFTFVVFRYLANGQPDSSFGSGGMVTPAQNGIQSATEVLIQPDGKILVGAYLTTGAAGNFALWRFNSDGTPDAGFGNGGVVTPSADSPLNHASGTLLLQSGGKILSIGERGSSFIIVRYNPNDTPDTSFGNGGKAETQIQDQSGAADAAFQPDGKIVLVGYSRLTVGFVNNIAMARYTAEGALDTSFGNGGTIFTDFGGNTNSAAASVLIQSNGKIIISGYRNVANYQSSAMLARFHQSGTLDTSFGVRGYVVYQYSTPYSVTTNMILQPDGKLVTVGNIFFGKYSEYATVARHLLNGAREFDFDGDRKADVSIFRPNSAAEWYWLKSSNNQSSGIEFGNGADKPVPADYDGDGKSDIAVFRDGDWYRLNSSNNQFVAIHFGQSEDVAAPSDYDGDSKADLAVYRQGNWYILNSSDNSFRAEQFGISTDKPITGADFDGDVKSDLAVYRDGIWYAQRSRDGFFGAQFGIGSDKPVAADYDGDGKTDLAVFRPSDGMWYLQRSHLGFTAMQFGISTDKAVPADYDNDGKTDIAVYRDGIWYLQQSGAGFRTVQFGAATDVPVPAALLP